MLLHATNPRFHKSKTVSWLFVKFLGNIYYLEVTNCTGSIAYIDRVIMHKNIAKDVKEVAVAHFKIYFQRF